MKNRDNAQKALFLGLGVALLGAGVMASANKAVPGKKAGPGKTATVAKKRQPVSQAAAPPPSARAKVAKKQTAVVGSAGWIYRKPGSPLPQVTTPRSVRTSRQVVVKDPRYGVQVELPPMTYSVATIDSKGKLNYDCEPSSQVNAKAEAAHTPH